MSLLEARGNAALAHEVRLRLRVRRDLQTPLVVVEGATDSAAYVHFLDNGVDLHPVGGRDRVLAVYDEFAGDPQAQSVLFLIDCDNGVDSRYKGSSNLVISQNRDLESDLLISLAGLERLICEERNLPLSLLSDAVATAVVFGRIKDSARECRVPVRKRVVGYSRRVRLNPAEFLNGDGSRPLGAGNSEADWLSWMASEIGWSQSEKVAVEGELYGEIAPLCTHSTIAVCECVKKFCNGHDLMDIAYAFVGGVGLQIARADFERAIRMGASDHLAQRWVVVQRLRRFEAVSGLRVVSARVGGGVVEHIPMQLPSASAER